MYKIVLITLFVAALHILPTVAKATEISITGNGNTSNNSVSIEKSNSTNVTQNNTAAVDTTVTQTANTGDNSASNNNGNVNVKTGDVAVKTTVDTTLNYSEVTGKCCPNGDVSVTIAGNGSNSTNQATATSNTSAQVTSNNNATVTNTISGYVNTGNNKAYANTGTVSITTGSVTIDEKILNNNINNAQVTYSVNTSGKIEMKIKNNGEGSVNGISYINNSTELLLVKNNASILNLSNWIVTTGENKADDNNGDVSIKTGDIYIRSLIASFDTNSSSIDSFCCNENQDNTGKTNKNPDHTSQPNNPSTGIGGPTSPGGAGGGSNSGSNSNNNSILGLATGNILPATGSLWTLWMTILAGILFLSGLYLRLNPGNAPNSVQLSF